MIEKQITMDDGETYLVGFKEVGSDKDAIECHILKKVFFINKSVYHKFYLKGISPDYKNLAHWTINEYIDDCKRKEALLTEKWS